MNLHFEDLQVSLAYYALRFGDLKSVDWAFGFLSDTLCSAPCGAGGGLHPPKGDHRRPPALYHLRVEAGP